MARYGPSFKSKAVAWLLPPERAAVELLALQGGVGAGALDRWQAEWPSVRPQAKPQEGRRSKELERHLWRLDRALAETLVLLVLSKKVGSVFNKRQDA